MNVNKKESPTVKLSISPYPANGEVVELDVLNDLVQQSVSHGVEICKCVGLQRNRQKENVESAGSRQSGNTPRKCPWALYRLAPIDTYLVPFRHEEV